MIELFQAGYELYQAGRFTPARVLFVQVCQLSEATTETPSKDAADAVRLAGALVAAIDSGAAAEALARQQAQAEADKAAAAEALQLIAQAKIEKRQHAQARRERKAYIRREVLAMRQQGATQTEMRLQLGISGWELGFALKHLQRTGEL